MNTNNQCIEVYHIILLHPLEIGSSSDVPNLWAQKIVLNVKIYSSLLALYVDMAK